MWESTHFQRGRISDKHVCPDTDIHLDGFKKFMNEMTLKNFTCLREPNEYSYRQNDSTFIRPGKKNFGSGQLIFENWSGGPVDLFFEQQLKFSNQIIFSTSHKDHIVSKE